MVRGSPQWWRYKHTVRGVWQSPVVAFWVGLGGEAQVQGLAVALVASSVLLIAARVLAVRQPALHVNNRTALNNKRRIVTDVLLDKKVNTLHNNKRRIVTAVLLDKKVNA